MRKQTITTREGEKDSSARFTVRMSMCSACNLWQLSKDNKHDKPGCVFIGNQGQKEVEKILLLDSQLECPCIQLLHT